MLDTYHLDYSAQLLTGSTKKKAAIYKKICSGKIQLLVGTHAVITEKVEFSNLGLVITDEQHRFGVKQRETLEQKGIYPPDFQNRFRSRLQAKSDSAGRHIPFQRPEQKDQKH